MAGWAEWARESGGVIQMEERLAGKSGRSLRDVGGTSGGLGSFLLGVVMAAGGGYLFLEKVTVRTSYWSLFGYNAFGLSLLPLLFGILLLFFNGKGILGWLLVVAGLAIIFFGVLMSMDIFFQPTSLFQTLMILILLVGGLGLVGRSLLPR